MSCAPSWRASFTARLTASAARPPLAGAATTDTVVIGAGFTGLSTALSLRKAGIDVVGGWAGGGAPAPDPGTG